MELTFQASVDESWGEVIDGATHNLIIRGFEQRPEEYARIYRTRDGTASVYRDSQTGYIVSVDSEGRRNGSVFIGFYGENLQFAGGVPDTHRSLERTVERFKAMLNPLVNVEQMN